MLIPIKTILSIIFLVVANILQTQKRTFIYGLTV